MSKVFSQKFNQIKDFNQKFDIMILVTGSSGFIGSNLIQYLKKRKKSFYGIDLKQNKYLKFKNFAKVDISSLRSVHNFLKKKAKHCDSFSNFWSKCLSSKSRFSF